MKKPYFSYIDRGMIKAGNKYMLEMYNFAKSKKEINKEIINKLKIKKIVKFLTRKIK